MLPSSLSASEDVAMASSEAEAASEMTSAVEDDSGRVWIIMFGFVMLLATAANLLLLKVVGFKGFRTRGDYRVIVALSLLSFAEFGLLSFDFSLGIEHKFPFGDFECVAYQVFQRLVPIAQSLAVASLLLKAVVDIGAKFAFVISLAFIGLAAPIVAFARVDDGFCQVSLGAPFYLTYSAVFEFWLPLLVSVFRPFLYIVSDFIS